MTLLFLLHVLQMHVIRADRETRDARDPFVHPRHTHTHTHTHKKKISYADPKKFMTPFSNTLVSTGRHPRFMRCVRHGLIDLPGEAARAWSSSSSSSASMSSSWNAFNDDHLVQVATAWNDRVGVSGNVLILTSDHGVVQRAKSRGVACALLNIWDAALGYLPSEVPWTATTVRTCFPPSVFLASDGKTPLRPWGGRGPHGGDKEGVSAPDIHGTTATVEAEAPVAADSVTAAAVCLEEISSPEHGTSVSNTATLLAQALRSELDAARQLVRELLAAWEGQALQPALTDVSPSLDAQSSGVVPGDQDTDVVDAAATAAAAGVAIDTRLVPQNFAAQMPDASTIPATTELYSRAMGFCARWDQLVGHMHDSDEGQHHPGGAY